MIEYSYTADETTSNLCSSCHSIARVLSERRTKEEWQLLVAMHRAYYPLVDTQPMNGGQGFMRSGGRGARNAQAARAAPTPTPTPTPRHRGRVGPRATIVTPANRPTSTWRKRCRHP